MSKGVVQLLLEVLCMWLKRKKKVFSPFPGAFGIWDLGSFLIGKLPQPPINLLTSKPRTAEQLQASYGAKQGGWGYVGFVWASFGCNENINYWVDY